MEHSAPAAGRVQLSEDEAHHALRVVRVRPGDAVSLFDGGGGEWLGTVEDASKHGVWIAVESHRVEPPPARPITLLQGWLHNDKAVECIIRHGAALGVAECCFFRADHSEKTPRVSEKWRRLAVESCKQSGRCRLPVFRAADSLEEALNNVSGLVLAASMDRPARPLRESLSRDASGPITLVIGPEGDFSEEEYALLGERSAAPLSLGTTTYRAEVAALLALSLAQYELGEMG